MLGARYRRVGGETEELHSAARSSAVPRSVIVRGVGAPCRAAVRVPGCALGSGGKEHASRAGSGLMGSSSASFMGTFLASSLGSPPSHPPHPSGPPSSPSSPSFRGGPHSSASQIWFPHSHEDRSTVPRPALAYAAQTGSLPRQRERGRGTGLGGGRGNPTPATPGYPRFSGSLAPTFLPMSHLDHPGNGSVLYGQHRFYDTQKDNFYLRSLPSQPPLLPANHSFPPISRAAPGHPLGSCSRERDSGGRGGVHKTLKEGVAERGGAPGPKEKERPGSKQEAKDRPPHGPQPLHGPHLHPSPLAGDSSRALERHKAALPVEYKDDPLSRGKHLSTCLLNSKTPNGDSAAKGPLSSCGGGGGAQARHAGDGGNARCSKEGVGGEMRISEHPPDCLERGQVLQHSVPSYSMPPPLTVSGGGNPGGFPCLQLHPHHPHHPPHPHPHHHPDFYCPAPPAPLPTPPAPDRGPASGGRDPKGAKPGPFPGTLPYPDCSHSGPPAGGQPPDASKGAAPAGGGAGGAGFPLQRDGQKVARIRHQPSGRPGADGSEPGHSGLLPPLPTWAEEQGKVFADSFCGGSRQQQAGTDPQGPQGPQAEGNPMKSLLRYGSQQPHVLLSQRSPFGGLGCLKSGGGGSSCALQEGKQTLPPRRAAAGDGDRPDCGGRGRDTGDSAHGEGEVRQPPVGIAVAVARQRDPPCRPPDGHASHSRAGRVLPTMKGIPRSVFPLDRDGEGERKRMCEDQLGLPCMDRERELFLRDNKERVEFPRIHPSSSCHGDLTSHLMVPGGASLQASQLGSDPAAHAHPAHHHWMPRTGSPSLWMPGHSYGIGHTLHQNVPPGFSPAMPGPLQPVLPLPQDPATQLVVLPAEPAAHPAAHHLAPITWASSLTRDRPSCAGGGQGSRDVALRLSEGEQCGLLSHTQSRCTEPVGPLSHSSCVHSFYGNTLQHHQHRATQAMETQHRHSHAQTQRKMEDSSSELEDLLSNPQTPKPAKPFSFTPSSKSTPSPGACAARLSPCCRSPPSLRPHPKSTPSTPCPAPSPATAPRSPALSPAPTRPPKAAESQDKRAEGQPPQDYPQSLEPDLPPEYTYPTMGYRGGPSPQDVRLAEPADLEAEAKPDAVEPRWGVEVGRAESSHTHPELLEQKEAELFLCSAAEAEITDPAPVCRALEAAAGDDPSVTHEGGAGEGQEEEEEPEEGPEETLHSGDPGDIPAPAVAGEEEPGRELTANEDLEELCSPLPTPPPATPLSQTPPPGSGAWSC
ncbi:hypothetical protein MATL_G00000660 [Megalops atlanticus]|uniref:BAH domain and coiled-coil containing 1 n=1 Tax=Megalops atlanticus TaxID=7932 RepID=A0A9D3QIJ0_MEGAT|nr:hypothetical protein MATL_G00000660 [Megalops atlanticus]